MDVAKNAKELVESAGINLASTISFEVNSTVMELSLEYIIDTYMQASPESQLVFLAALQKAVDGDAKMGVEKFFEGMGQLLLMTQLSKKFS
jgi:hypothetical protein